MAIHPATGRGTGAGATVGRMTTARLDEYTIRDATVTDIPELVRLVQSAYRGEESRRGWTTEADLLDGIRADPEYIQNLIETPESAVLLVTDPAVLACCHVARRDGAGYFGMFAVRPARQGGGLGRALLAEAERRAVALGCARMRMTVISARTDLIDWYRRRGYAETGRREPFPYGDERFGKPRRDDLEFVELAKSLA